MYGMKEAIEFVCFMSKVDNTQRTRAEVEEEEENEGFVSISNSLSINLSGGFVSLWSH